MSDKSESSESEPEELLLLSSSSSLAAAALAAAAAGACFLACFTMMYPSRRIESANAALPLGSWLEAGRLLRWQGTMLDSYSRGCLV